MDILNARLALPVLLRWLQSPLIFCFARGITIDLVINEHDALVILAGIENELRLWLRIF